MRLAVTVGFDSRLVVRALADIRAGYGERFRGSPLRAFGRRLAICALRLVEVL